MRKTLNIKFHTMTQYLLVLLLRSPVVTLNQIFPAALNL